MRANSGYVYAIGIEGTALVKIGHARDVAKRLAALQTGFPYRLVVLHQEQVEEPRRLERALHAILEVVRERGEWFELPEVYFPSLFAQGIALGEDGPEEEHAKPKAPWQKTLGDTLHQLRRDRRLTLRELAQQVHVNYTDISKLERGERPQITFEAVLKLADFYGVSLDALLDREEVHA